MAGVVLYRSAKQSPERRLVQGAQANGLTVSWTPVVGAIDVFAGDGHVAVPESDAGTSMVISDMNNGGEDSTVTSVVSRL